MKKNVLFRTNLLVCIVIAVGFVITSYISYQSNQGIFRNDVENVSNLTSEGIYHQIDSIFTKPINISLTMANDSLLKEFLQKEQLHLDDTAFIDTMRDYLNTYRVKYNYDSVFLASVRTKRYYYFNGLDRTLEDGDEENQWFYNFLDQDQDYGIQIDNDQVEGAGNEVTVFINCRIKNNAGETMGVVGVGFRVDTLQELLKSYETNFAVNATLVDTQGYVEVSTDDTRYESTRNLFDSSAFSSLKDSILNSADESKYLWYSSKKGNGYVVSRYIENLDWYLLVENDTTVLKQRLAMQLVREVLIVIVTILLVMLTITTVIRRYMNKIVELSIAAEKKHMGVFRQAAEQLYEDIYEIDITHNRAASEATSQYFESLGAPPDIPFDEALQVIARKQIKEEYREGYINTFKPESILKSYEEGTENLRYEFMISVDGVNYYWMRIIAHIFRWGEDDSVRILVYRQNIDKEKQYELNMMEQMQKDSLTGLYNKIATREHVCQLMDQEPKQLFAFFILDIDHFKEINDRLGHAAGDAVLVEFAKTLQQQFQEDDVVGRIGGDEFTAFTPVKDLEHTRGRAEKLVDALRRHLKTEEADIKITASVGVVLASRETADFETLYRQADLALYKAKKQGRNRFVIAGIDGG